MGSDLRLGINAQRVAHQAIDGEVIIIDFDTGAYYSTDKTGAEVWGSIAEGATLGQIIGTLAERYAGDRMSIASAVSQFVDELAKEDLITSTYGGAADDSARPTQGPPTDRPAFEAPVLCKYTDMEDLLLADPIHQVGESGWPAKRQTER